MGRVAASVGPMLAHAGMDIDFAIEHLERLKKLRFRCGRGRSVQACLAWNDGTLNCEFRDLALGLTYSKDELTIEGRTVPEAALTALQGRRLESLVLHPCLPPGAVIVSATNKPGSRGGVKVALEPSSSPLAAEITDQERVAITRAV